MVDTTEAMESKYLTADVVKESTTKIISFIEEGEYEPTDFGRRLTMTIEIDQKQKVYRPNRDSVCNLSYAFGRDTNLWIGKQAKLQVIKIQGKNSIIATPLVVGHDRVD